MLHQNLRINKFFCAKQQTIFLHICLMAAKQPRKVNKDQTIDMLSAL